MQRELSFLSGVGCELSLLVVAFFWGLLFSSSAFGQFRWDLEAAGIGVAAAIPLFLFFLWTLKSKLPVLSRHRHVLDFLIRQLFGRWPIWQLAVISICAGVCEEALFRGALQASLTEWVGVGGAVAIVSLLFGASHLLSWTYGIIATAMGVYLGLLFYFTGDLLAPVLTHGFYDFAALVYFVRVYHPNG